MENLSIYQGYEKRIYDYLGEIKNRFVLIAQNLVDLESSKYYEKLGYIKFVDYCEDKFGFSPTMTRNLISINRCFCNGIIIKKDYENYSFSQLVEMVPLTQCNNSIWSSSWLSNCKSNMTVKEIREYKKNIFNKNTITNIPNEIISDNKQKSDVGFSNNKKLLYDFYYNVTNRIARISNPYDYEEENKLYTTFEKIKYDFLEIINDEKDLSDITK